MSHLGHSVDPALRRALLLQCDHWKAACLLGGEICLPQRLNEQRLFVSQSVIMQSVSMRSLILQNFILEIIASFRHLLTAIRAAKI